MGFSGWAPGQLDSEMQREGWYVLPASEEIVFRAETSGMWGELVEKARGGRAESGLCDSAKRQMIACFWLGMTRIHVLSA